MNYVYFIGAGMTLASYPDLRNSKTKERRKEHFNRIKDQIKNNPEIQKGAPLTSELLTGILTYTPRKDKELHDKDKLEQTRKYIITWQETIKSFLTYQNLKAFNKGGEDINDYNNDILDVLTYLREVEIRSDYYGAHNLDSNRTLEHIIVSLIGNFLFTRLGRLNSDLDEKFAQYLVNKIGNKFIITTNYDIALENAIIREIIGQGKKISFGIPNMKFIEFDNKYDFHPDTEIPDPNYQVIDSPGYYSKDMNSSDIVILKPHGSLNWLYCRDCNLTYVLLQDKIFGRLIYSGEGPKCKEDGCNQPLRHTLVTPSYVQNTGIKPNSVIFDSIKQVLAESRHYRFIGYSLPNQDHFIRNLIRQEIQYRNTKPYHIARNEIMIQDMRTSGKDLDLFILGGRYRKDLEIKKVLDMDKKKYLDLQLPKCYHCKNKISDNGSLYRNYSSLFQDYLTSNIEKNKLRFYNADFYYWFTTLESELEKWDF